MSAPATAVMSVALSMKPPMIEPGALRSTSGAMMLPNRKSSAELTVRLPKAMRSPVDTSPTVLTRLMMLPLTSPRVQRSAVGIDCSAGGQVAGRDAGQAAEEDVATGIHRAGGDRIQGRVDIDVGPGVDNAADVDRARRVEINAGLRDQVAHADPTGVGQNVDRFTRDIASADIDIRMNVDQAAGAQPVGEDRSRTRLHVMVDPAMTRLSPMSPPALA